MQPKTIGRYEIIKQLGQGGMASVFLAEDPVMGRKVALKLLPSDTGDNSAFRARFENEARAMAGIVDDSILTAFDFGEDNGTQYLVIEYMPGGSLQEKIEAGTLSLAETHSIFNVIASGLDKAHQSGIVHRDLKPANILFNADDKPRVADFGIAKILAHTETLTQAGTSIGTPFYMSPEQFDPKVTLDGRTDIYALGIIAYQMLTGQLPFRSETWPELIRQHLMDNIPPLPASLKAQYPQLQAVLDKATHKNRDSRHNSVREFANELQFALAGEAGAQQMDATVIEPLDKTLIVNEPSAKVPPVAANVAKAAPPAEPAPKKRRSRLAIAAVVGLGLFVALCGVGLLVLRGLGGSDPEPTAVVVVEPTATTEVVVETEPTPEPETPTDIPPTEEVADSCYANNISDLEAIAAPVRELEILFRDSSAFAAENRTATVNSMTQIRNEISNLSVADCLGVTQSQAVTYVQAALDALASLGTDNDDMVNNMMFDAEALKVNVLLSSAEAGIDETLFGNLDTPTTQMMAAHEAAKSGATTTETDNTDSQTASGWNLPNPDGTAVFDGSDASYWEFSDTRVAADVNNGVITMTIKEADSYVVNGWPTEYGDVVLQVETRQLDGQAGDGLMSLFCRAPDVNSMYTFSITNEGSYSIYKLVDGQWTALLDWTKSADLARGNQWNVLRASCVGSTLTFWANGVELGSVQDSTLTGVSNTGIFAATITQNNTNFEFDNLQVGTP